MKKWTPANIRKLRNDLGLTQPDFGKMLGITVTYVSLIEKKGGVKKPGATLCRLLDCIKKDIERR